MGIYLSVDPLFHLYPHMSLYAYCGNNPVKFVDPTGMYFDDVNERKAQKIESALQNRVGKLERQVNKVQRNGGDITELNERIGEINTSLSDIYDMRNDRNTEFKYAKTSNRNNELGTGSPAISPSGVNANGHDVVTMYADNTGDQIHESRHGGQVARGEYGYNQDGNANANFNINFEVSAYRAQYSYYGKLSYYDASNALNHQMYNVGMTPLQSTLINISLITPDFVRTKIGGIEKYSIFGRRHERFTAIYRNL